MNTQMIMDKFAELSSELIDLYYVPIVFQDEMWKKAYVKAHTEYVKYYHMLYD